VSDPADADSSSLAETGIVGCGLLSRESLELAAIARIDREIEIDERTSTHLVLCPRCLEAVAALEKEHSLLTELAHAARPEPVRGAGGDASVPATAEEIPGYRLTREIHRGGQGAVYLAEQLATRRTCAVKMLLGGRFAGGVQRMRFEREVEVVAALRHPAIVTLYESGLSRTGEPWFAMEFVEGERLDEFVRRTKRSPRDIAAIMQRVADAIAYAHRRGVIHRDLKPGNILIDSDGAPRILDFGLARSSSGEANDPRSGSTLAGEFVGTFAYAAPEQLAGDPSLVDSRCDLYALGVVFYELLAGRRPFEGARSIADLVGLKSAGATRRPSAIGRDLGWPIDTDLDVIALRLLSPDPARRYESAAALSEDLARYLDGRPILAREDSVAYVLTKTVKRHKFASSAAAVFALTVVAAGVALFVAYSSAEEQRRVADRERIRAEAERERSERAYMRFRSALESANPEEGPALSTMNVRDFLEVVEERVRREMEDEPVALAQMLETLGMIQLGFDEPDRSRDAIQTAHRLIVAAHEEGRVGDEERAIADIALAKQCFADGELDRAETEYREAIALLERSSDANPVLSVDTMRHLATVLRRRGLIVEAGEVLERACLRAAALPGSNDAFIVRAGILNGRGVLAAEQQDHARAIDAFREALEVLSMFVPENDYRRGRTLSSLAASELKLGLLMQAEQDAVEAVRILTERKGPDALWTREAIALLDAIRAASPPKVGPES
jgi:tetratricopeptide (TPR) repeat protein/predicted Ser/Thr protein kinase